MGDNLGCGRGEISDMRHIFSLLVLLTIAVSQQAPPKQESFDHSWPHHPDARWWNKLATTDRISFIEGFTSASSTVAGTRIVDVPSCENVVNGLMNGISQRYDFGQIAVGQYIVGLDDFYHVDSNQNIPVDGAIFYVRDKIRGVPPSVLDKELEEIKHL